MAHKQLPPSDLLRKLLRYEPETGKLFWRRRCRSFFTSDTAWKIWNTRYCDTEALTTPDVRGYFRGRLLKEPVAAHRIAWAMHYGHGPDGEIDHINGNRADNRIDNLRVVTSAENKKNLAMNSRNTSGISGVGWHKATGKWRAYLRVAGKHKQLGLFLSKQDAAQAVALAKAENGFCERHGLPLEWEYKMTDDILAFQQGREAAMEGKLRDKRRSKGWLEGYDAVASPKQARTERGLQ